MQVVYLQGDPRKHWEKGDEAEKNRKPGKAVFSSHLILRETEAHF